MLAILNSAFANSKAGANAAMRVGFALGRVGILPRQLARVHPRFKTPYIAIHAKGVLGIAVALGLGAALYNTGSAPGPLNAFALLGTIATIIVVGIYILTNLANIVFYLRVQRSELNILWNLIVPALGILIFIPVLIAAFGIDFGGLAISPLSALANAATWVVVAWLVTGGILYFVLSSRSRPRSRRLQSP